MKRRLKTRGKSCTLQKNPEKGTFNHIVLKIQKNYKSQSESSLALSGILEFLGAKSVKVGSFILSSALSDAEKPEREFYVQFSCQISSWKSAIIYLLQK